MQMHAETNANMESPVKSLTRYVKLIDINQYITCQLCGGYLVDATTITECLHTFCKSCIVKYLETSILCPTCDVKIHETWPYYSIRLDRTMQDIVHKLLPQTEKEEKRRQGIFYKERGMPWPPPEPKPVAIPSIEESCVSFILEFIGASSDFCENIKTLEKKFIRVSNRATVKHVQLFLIKKLDLDRRYEVDIICNDEIMEPEVTLGMINSVYRKEQEEDIMILNYGIILQETAF
ncbi:polycomb group RING finger protein 6-like [Saccoglossus kowalevskii]